MAISQGLDPVASELIVTEMVSQLGEAATLVILGITPGRLAVLVAGRGRLREVQAHRIAAVTRKTGSLWLLDGGERRARTPRQKQAVLDSRVMRDCFERSAVAEIARAEAALTSANDQQAAARRAKGRKPKIARSKASAA